MTDPAHKETDKILDKMMGDIWTEYQQAVRETSAKLDEYMRQFERKDQEWKAKLDAGEITQKEYNDWRIGQVMVGQRWEEMKDTLSEDMLNANNLARSTIDGYMPDVYALNHNYATFQVEKGAKVDTSYTLYDRQTVERLNRKEQILPKPGKRVAEDIRQGKVKAWNEGQIQSVMTQAILQGESVGNISKRVMSTVGARDMSSATRYARTATTAAENAGRVDGYKRAEDMGIKMMQQWVATLDNRVRDSHAEMDGLAVEVGAKFPNGCEYPGDPSGPPEEVWNCRCTLIAQVEKFERDVTDTDIRSDTHIGGLTYDEWMDEHSDKYRYVL